MEPLEAIAEAEEVPIGLMWARKRVCLGPENPCPHHRVCRAWQWPRCQAGSCDEDGTPLLEITKEFLLGPASGCPKELWDGLDPVDTERPPLIPEEWGRRAEQYIVTNDPLLSRLSNDDLKQALVEMIERGLHLLLAEEIAKQKGLELDVNITPAVPGGSKEI